MTRLTFVVVRLVTFNKLVGHFSYKVSCTLNHSTKCTNIVNVDENDKGNALTSTDVLIGHGSQTEPYSCGQLDLQYLYQTSA